MSLLFVGCSQQAASLVQAPLRNDYKLKFCAPQLFNLRNKGCGLCPGLCPASWRGRCGRAVSKSSQISSLLLGSDLFTRNNSTWRFPIALLLEILDSGLDRILCQHAAMQLHRRQLQMRRNVSVLDCQALIDGLPQYPLGSHRAAKPASVWLQNSKSGSLRDRQPQASITMSNLLCPAS